MAADLLDSEGNMHCFMRPHVQHYCLRRSPRPHNRFGHSHCLRLCGPSVHWVTSLRRLPSPPALPSDPDVICQIYGVHKIHVHFFAGNGSLYVVGIVFVNVSRES